MIDLRETDMSVPPKPKQGKLRVRNIKEMSKTFPSDAQEKVEKSVDSNVNDYERKSSDENQKKCLFCHKIIHGGAKTIELHETECKKSWDDAFKGPFKCHICINNPTEYQKSRLSHEWKAL